MAERRSSVTEWMRGTVASANERGIKLEGEEDWLNWSQYVAEGDRTTPRRGSKVRVGLDNRNFVREVQDEHGSKLTGNAGGGGSGANSTYRGVTPEDSWRMTLLSCLSSAADLITNMPDESLGGAKRTDATYNLALHWARQVWMSQMPKPAQTAPESDDAGE